MILITDTHYDDPSAVTSGVVLSDWTDNAPQQECVFKTQKVEPYKPGQFYKRELPCILGLIKKHKLSPSHMVIDGHVYLDGSSQWGLGAYLYDALDGACPVIGVAKNRFKNMPQAHALLRGQSQTPLWITAAGMSYVDAQDLIRAMAGPFRLPDMIKRADQLARGKAPNSSCRV